MCNGFREYKFEQNDKLRANSEPRNNFSRLEKIKESQEHEIDHDARGIALHLFLHLKSCIASGILKMMLECRAWFSQSIFLPHAHYKIYFLLYLQQSPQVHKLSRCGFFKLYSNKVTP